MENQQDTSQNYLNFQTSLPNATAVLVLGILSIIGCFCYGSGLVMGVIALILARKDIRLYSTNPSAYTPSSLSNIKAGRVCAIIGTVISSIYVLLIIIALIIFGATFFADPQGFIKQMQTH
ncbi:CCC motif membrane protein [Pinibacter soli]|uniref:CCC motif membrane protein n=1 Tax=Pinibacter soli TaxID=3044211 RepID=A0ABT6R8N5_9BACT|nr:CCC motif membrane protein [Pinibacter soli]MDI3318924.1 CCC motif membrane protein [Pinibacter soli]